MLRMIPGVLASAAVLAAMLVSLNATPAPPRQASAATATRSIATGKTITAADCTAERLGTSISPSAIGEPVRSITLSAPSWVESANGGPAHCRVNGSMAPIDAATTARPINFSVALPASWSGKAAQLVINNRQKPVKRLTIGAVAPVCDFL